MTDEKEENKPFLFKQNEAVAIISINKPPMNMMSNISVIRYVL